MLDKVQGWLDFEIRKVTDVEKTWVDTFKPNKKNSKNQIVIRLVSSKNNLDLCGNTQYMEYNFEIFVVGVEKRTKTRDLTEQIYNQLNARDRDTYNDITIILSRSSNQSFQFLENDKTSVNRFEIKILVKMT